jgi:hypothetical protein
MNRAKIERKRTTFRVAANQDVICMGSGTFDQRKRGKNYNNIMAISE